MPLLEIEGLSVEFPTGTGVLKAVDDVNLTIEEGEVLGIVGESGSGKSVTMLALMGLVPYPGRVGARRLTFDGRDLQMLDARQRRRLTGKSLAMIFQDPATSLNPCFPIGFQIMESLVTHERLDWRAARRRAIELLAQVGIPEPESRMRAFPHQLSGGMCQRAMIAMAIACKPQLLIADEPTTALDVTIQAQIIDLLQSLQRDYGMAMILITHNMGLVAETASRIAVMYAGQMVEMQPAAAIFEAPEHPYTAALLSALPERCRADGRLATIPGVVPGAWDRPPGCLFQPRCASATPRCPEQTPPLRPAPPASNAMTTKPALVRCHYPLGDPARDERRSADGANNESKAPA